MKKITKVFLSVIAVTFSLNSFAVEWAKGPGVRASDNSVLWMQDSDLNVWDLSKIDFWDGGTKAGAESVIKKLNGKMSEMNALLAKKGYDYKIVEFRAEPIHNGIRPGVYHIVSYSVATRPVLYVELDWDTGTHSNIQVGEPYFYNFQKSIVLISPDGKESISIGVSNAQRCDSPGILQKNKKYVCI